MPNNNTSNNNTSADSTLIGFLAKARSKKVQKRIISLLSVVVLLLTLNQTKLIADTLQRIPMCGIAEHMHDEVCVNEAGEYICGLEEHAHTDACYQQRPMDIEEAVEAEVLETHALEAPVAETSVELSDEGEIAEPAPTVDDEAVVSGDVEEIPSETVVELGEDEAAADSEPADTIAVMPTESEASSPVFDFEGRDYVALSEILPVLPLQMEEVVDVLAVLDEDQETSPIIIEKVEQDYTIYVIERFAWTDIAVETEDGLKTITLIDGGTREEDLRLQTEEISVTTEEMVGDEKAPNEGGSEEQTVAVPAEGEEEQTETVPAEGEEEQTVALPTDGEEEQTETVPAEGEEEQTVALPTDGEEEQTETVPTEGEEEQAGEGQSDEEASDEGTDAHADGEEEGDTSVDDEAVESAEDEEQTVESSAEDETDESAVEDETSESDTEGDDVADEVQEQQPQVVADGFHTVIDLSEVEVLPLSLREIVGKMEAEQSLIEQSAVEPAVTEETDAPRPEVIEEQIAEDAQSFEDQADDNRPEAQSTENIESMDVEPAAEEVVVELGEEQADDTVVDKAAADETATDETTVDYDSALLSLAPVMDGETVTDYAIDVIADFDSTDVIVNGQYTITLLNGVNPCPAQSFIASTEYMNVSVTADAGAFPAWTTMEVSDVVDDETISGIADSVTGNFVEVERVHAVDISFRDVDGREIEPKIPISVVMTVKEQIEEDRETVVVHMDNEGGASVVEAAPAGQEENADAAEPAEEIVPDPQTVAFTSDSFSVYAVVVTRKLETSVLASDGENYKIEVTYGPDAGIPDGAVLAVSEVTEDEEYRAQVEAGLAGNKMITLARFFDIKIMESAAEDAAEVHPAEAVEVRVWLEEAGETAETIEAPEEEISTPEEEAAAKSAEEATDAIAVEPDEGGTDDLSPEAEQLPEETDDHVITVGDPTACAAHFAGESTVDVMDAAEMEEAVVFMAEGFSVWGVVYTVDFYYGNYEWHIDGGSYVGLRDLVEKLSIAEDAKAFVDEVVDIVFSAPDLLAVSKVETDTTVGAIKEALQLQCEYSVNMTEDAVAAIDETGVAAGDWALISMRAFDSTETLSIRTREGAVYEIRVEDDNERITLHYNTNDLAGGTLRNSSVNPRIEADTFDVVVGWNANLNASSAQYNIGHIRRGDATKPTNDGYRFAWWTYWGTDEHGTYTIQYSTNQYIQPSGNDASSERTFTANFVPVGQLLFIYNQWTNGGSITYPQGCKSFVSSNGGSNQITQYFSYSGDAAFATAVPDATHRFDGWYAVIDGNWTRVCDKHTFDPMSVSSDSVVFAVFANAEDVTVEYHTGRQTKDNFFSDRDKGIKAIEGSTWQTRFSETVKQDHTPVGAEAMQSYTLDGKLATFYGWRYDTDGQGRIVTTERQLRDGLSINANASFTAMFLYNCKRALLQVNDWDYGDIIDASGNSIRDNLVPYTDTNNAVVLTRGADADGEYTFNLGREAFYTVKPETGYYLDHFEVNGQNVGLPAVGTPTTVSSNADNNVQYVKAVFEPGYSFVLRSNEPGAGYFTSDYFPGEIPENRKVAVPRSGNTATLQHRIDINVCDGWRFVKWLQNNGEEPDNLEKDTHALTTSTHLLTGEDTIYNAIFAPEGAWVIRLQDAQGPGSYSIDGTIAGHDPGQSRVVDTNGDRDWHYVYSNDNVTLVATPDNGAQFVGWFNGYVLVSREARYDVSRAEADMLTFKPIFEYPDNDHYRVYLDYSNGIRGGQVANNTFFSRIESTGNVAGSRMPELNWVSKPSGGYITLPSAYDAAHTPQSQGDNWYKVYGWYDINKHTYHQPGDQVWIDQDTVFYADWFPENYDFGYDDGHLQTGMPDTRNFITTKMFDYNNIFNIDQRSIMLNIDRSVITGLADNSRIDNAWAYGIGNYEYWEMDPNRPHDFVFMSTVSGIGRSLNPKGRNTQNSNNETTTNGTYYSGMVAPGILDDSGLKNILFNDQEYRGKKYIGEADWLYRFDENTGYYFYDSDKNAASYNQMDGRFYVYSYTNKTNKSNDGDNTDFLPFNYGQREFNETYSAPNYWFGMSSAIDFFLPNAAGFKDAHGVYGNRSVKNDDMLFKFAGDDDVWVYVDDQLILDMGGVHGKVYGEINFSKGTWTIAQNGVSKVANSPTIDFVDTRATDPEGNPINNDQVHTGTLNLAEGKHTLTIYYLERGSSQSNCAIYFNIAPAYPLRIEKKDAESGNGLGGAKFKVYTDAVCTQLADVTKIFEPGSTNFVTGNDGWIHMGYFYGGRTYYIKEVEAPKGYPDVSDKVIELTFSSTGVPSARYVNGDALTTGTFTYDDIKTFIKMEVPNTKNTNITAKKVWRDAEGNSVAAPANASIRLKLYRYQMIENENDEHEDHTVQLVTCYLVDGDGKGVYSDLEATRIVRAGTMTYKVGHGDTMSFDVTANHNTDALAIYQATTSSVTNMVMSERYFGVANSMRQRPISATLVQENITRDMTLYLYFIGDVGDPPKLDDYIMITEPTLTHADQTVTGRKSSDVVQEIVLPVNGTEWSYTWMGLDPYYNYYVKEEELSIDGDSNALYQYTDMYSSYGITGGTVEVTNQYEMIRVKLRKRDGTTGGNLSGAKFKILSSYQSNTTFDPKPGYLLNESTYDSGTKEFTSGNDGVFYNGFLPQGRYWLLETDAPDGYDMLTEPIELLVRPNEIRYKSLSDTKYQSKTPNANDSNTISVYIDNTPGYALPSTGGPGTTLFYVFGSLLTLLAAALLLCRKHDC